MQMKAVSNICHDLEDRAVVGPQTFRTAFKDSLNPWLHIEPFLIKRAPPGLEVRDSQVSNFEHVVWKLLSRYD